jgi:hypothetical protein
MRRGSDERDVVPVRDVIAVLQSEIAALGAAIAERVGPVPYST